MGRSYLVPKNSGAQRISAKNTRGELFSGNRYFTKKILGYSYLVPNKNGAQLFTEKNNTRKQLL